MRRASPGHGGEAILGVCPAVRLAKTYSTAKAMSALVILLWRLWLDGDARGFCGASHRSMVNSSRKWIVIPEQHR
jgi:hypothetical protein